MNQVADQSKNNITGVNNAASSSNLLQSADNQNLVNNKIVTTSTRSDMNQTSIAPVPSSSVEQVQYLCVRSPEEIAK